MIDQRKIPSGYTGCEEYRGYVIAITKDLDSMGLRARRLDVF